MTYREAYIMMLQAVSKLYRDEKTTWANMQETVAQMWEAVKNIESQPKEE